MTEILILQRIHSGLFRRLSCIPFCLIGSQRHKRPDVVLKSDLVGYGLSLITSFSHGFNGRLVFFCMSLRSVVSVEHLLGRETTAVKAISTHLLSVLSNPGLETRTISYLWRSILHPCPSRPHTLVGRSSSTYPFLYAPLVAWVAGTVWW